MEQESSSQVCLPQNKCSPATWGQGKAKNSLPTLGTEGSPEVGDGRAEAVRSIQLYLKRGPLLKPSSEHLPEAMWTLLFGSLGQR